MLSSNKRSFVYVIFYLFPFFSFIGALIPSQWAQNDLFFCFWLLIFSLVFCPVRILGKTKKSKKNCESLYVTFDTAIHQYFHYALVPCSVWNWKWSDSSIYFFLRMGGDSDGTYRLGKLLCFCLNSVKKASEQDFIILWWKTILFLFSKNGHHRHPRVFD